MAKKNEAKDLTPVTLIATEICTPYAKGDIFTVPKYVADGLLDPNRVDENDKIVSVKVRLFDTKAEAGVLAEFRGKSEDAPDEPYAAGSKV